MRRPSPRSALGRAHRRLRARGRALVQATLAVALAWLLATVVFGYDLPFYAPVAAIVTLGAASGATPRRATELAGGVALGILVADLLILALGTGPIQLVTVVLFAMAAATAVGGSLMVVNQAGISAVLVATLQPPTASLVPHRVLHAVIGGAVAVLVGQVLLRPPPLPRVVRAAQPVFAGLSGALSATAGALRTGEVAAAEQALLDARDLDPQVRTFGQALADAQDVASLTFGRRTLREQLRSHEEVLRQLDLAVRNTRVLARASIALLSSPPPDDAPDGALAAVSAAVEDLAAGVESLGDQLTEDAAPEAVRSTALHAVTHVGGLFPDRWSLSLARVVGQVRATSIDLLRGSGLELWDAQQLLDEQDRQRDQGPSGPDPR